MHLLAHQKSLVSDFNFCATNSDRDACGEMTITPGALFFPCTVSAHKVYTMSDQLPVTEAAGCIRQNLDSKFVVSGWVGSPCSIRDVSDKVNPGGEYFVGSHTTKDFIPRSVWPNE